MIYTLVRGDTFLSGTLTLKADGVVTNLSGMTIKFSVRHKLNSSTYLYGPVNAQIINTTLGTFKLTIDKSITATFPIGEIYYDIEITDNAGIRTTPIVDIIIVNPDITITTS